MICYHEVNLMVVSKKCVRRIATINMDLHVRAMLVIELILVRQESF